MFFQQLIDYMKKTLGSRTSNSENPKSLIARSITLSETHSFFLFGARGTGKSTLLNQLFPKEFCLKLDLLDDETAERFSRRPNELMDIVHGLSDEVTHVIIDEIQKIPKLLDVVHSLIEEKKKIFVMTGSSARKLKRGAANLLAGRAFVHHLFPFSCFELGNSFDLMNVLSYGSLPKIFELQDDVEKKQFLMSYAHTYLKEEILTEQLIRKLDPFRRFLEVSAQCNGKIINYSNIARDVGVDDKTVQQYFEILEDTLIGFFLEPFQHSFRKRLSLKPKFYYFDTGVVRSLGRLLSVPLIPHTSYFGEVFEHYVIIECIKLANYFKSEYRFSYLQTKDDAEVDLIVERPGLPILFIEIKSAERVEQEKLRSFNTLCQDFGACESVCFSRDPYAKQMGNILVLPWQEGLKRFFM